MLTYICVHCRYNLQNVWQICKTLRASTSRNYNSTIFYHLKKLLYHYTIPFYNTSSISKFYFPILFLKIIYPKTQIKTKTQITTCYHHDHEQPSTHRPINPSPIPNPSTHQQPQHRSNPSPIQTHQPNKPISTDQKNLATTPKKPTMNNHQPSKPTTTPGTTISHKQTHEQANPRTTKQTHEQPSASHE